MAQLQVVDDSQNYTQLSQGSLTVVPNSDQLVACGDYTPQVAPLRQHDGEPTVYNVIMSMRFDTNGMSYNQGVVSLMTYNHRYL